MRSLLVGGTFDSAKISRSKVREEGEAEGRRKKDFNRDLAVPSSDNNNNNNDNDNDN